MNRLMLLALIACTKTEGQDCDQDSDCRGKLVCRNNRCAVGAEMMNDMAKQSGVSVSGERPSIGSGAGAVHVRSAAGEDVVFAVCAPNERLVGGWCDPPGNGGDEASLTTSGAAGYTDDDTLGAQWKCRFEKKSVRAFALCQVAQ